MSKKTAELKNQIQEKGDEIKVLDKSLQALSAKRDAGSIEEAELKQFDTDFANRTALMDEVVTLNEELKREENFAQVKRDALSVEPGVQKVAPSLQKDMKRHFSLSRMALLSDEQLTKEAEGYGHDFGLTKEMNEEFQKEAKRFAFDVRPGSVGAPEEVMRAMSVLQDTGTKGGQTVDREFDTDVIRLFRNANNWRDLGARVKTNLKKDYEVVKEGSVLLAGWKGEIEDADLTDKTYSLAEMKPKRLTAQTLYSRQLMIQSELSVDNELQRDLFGASDDVLMDTLVNGNATAGINGLLNSAISLLEAGPDANTGGAMTYEKVVAMFTQLGSNNASMEGTAFLSNYKVAGSLMSTKKDAGSGQFVMENFNSLMNRPFVNNNFVPSDIVKGTSTATLSALILAHFPDIDVSQWGGFSLISDPYTKARSSQIVLTIDSFWDILVRRLLNHVAYKDVAA